MSLLYVYHGLRIYVKNSRVFNIFGQVNLRIVGQIGLRNIQKNFLLSFPHFRELSFRPNDRRERVEESLRINKKLFSKGFLHSLRISKFCFAKLWKSPLGRNDNASELFQKFKFVYVFLLFKNYFFIWFYSIKTCFTCPKMLKNHFILT